MISRKRVALLLGISWTIYLINFGANEPNAGSPAFRPTGAQFEYAFPILAWQMIYVHGVCLSRYFELFEATFRHNKIFILNLYTQY